MKTGEKSSYREPLIRGIKNHTPMIHETVFLAETAQIIGEVSIDKKSSVWYGAVLRGDVAPIKIGQRSNIQDNCVFHGTALCGVTVGNDVTIGHAVVLHGCQIGDTSLIGMGSCIMDKTYVPSKCIIGAGTLVTPESQFASGSLILGRPGRMVRKLTDEEMKMLEDSANNYILYSSWYKA